MTKETPIFSDIRTWLDLMCKTYTPKEIQMFGVLGFDVTHSATFAERYMNELMKEKENLQQIRAQNSSDEKFRFAELNERIYTKIMNNIKDSPEWIKQAADPNNQALLIQMSPLQQRLVKLYQKSQSNKAKIVSLDTTKGEIR